MVGLPLLVFGGAFSQLVACAVRTVSVVLSCAQRTLRWLEKCDADHVNYVGRDQIFNVEITTAIRRPVDWLCAVIPIRLKVDGKHGSPSASSRELVHQPN